MPRATQDTKIKEPIKLRKKRLANDCYRLYLDYYNPKTQKHEYEYLPYTIKPVRIPTDRLDNQNAINAANAVKSERIGELFAMQAGLKRVKQSKILLIDWMLYCAEEAEKRANTINRSTWGNTIKLTAELVRQYDGEHTLLVDVDKRFVKGFVEFLRHGHTIERNHKQQLLAPGTAHKRYQCLKYSLAEAQREGYIKVNPCDLLKNKEKLTAPESTRAYLTIEELKQMEATPAGSEKTRNVYLFMCYCGLRISDVKQLTWADIDTSSEPWIISKRQQKTKTPLYLPLSQKARQFMPEQGDAAPTDFVFADLPTEPSMNRSLKMWAKKAGIEKVLTLHTARHTLATTLLTKGADLYTVSKLLGHTDVATTQIYAKIVDSKKVEAVNLLNDL